MIIRQINIFTYQLPLRKPLKIKKQKITIREGAILQVKTDQNKISFGESAPLPGLHSENIEDALNQLAIIQSKLTGAHIPNISGIPGYLNTVMSANTWLPSVRFGVESALLNLYMVNEKKTNEKIFMPRRHDYVLINVLADGSQSDIVKAVRRGLDDGYQAVKIKVGRLTPEEDIVQVKRVYKLIKGKATLRLDANQAWDLTTAEHFLKGIADCDLEYIEEPLRKFQDLPVLYEKTRIPIAIDENIKSIPIVELGQNKWINTIVIKPAIIGSVNEVLEIIHRANELKIRCVLSDTFHSGIGLSFLVRLSASSDDMVPMGFDTYHCLKEDLLKKRLKVTGGCFNLNNIAISADHIDYAKLQEFCGSLSLYRSEVEAEQDEPI
jgi:o-succinylbenzoate synthase